MISTPGQQPVNWYLTFYDTKNLRPWQKSNEFFHSSYKGSLSKKYLWSTKTDRNLSIRQIFTFLASLERWCPEDFKSYNNMFWTSFILVMTITKKKIDWKMIYLISGRFWSFLFRHLFVLYVHFWVFFKDFQCYNNMFWTSFILVMTIDHHQKEIFTSNESSNDEASRGHKPKLTAADVGWRLKVTVM